ncbi:EFR1 family ferrodoxin [bacterium]|nr:EFR1 family ferrodoxin [bacterium]
MKTVLFYYTGTGNSLWVAQQMAAALTDCEIFSMARINSDVLHVQADAVGLVFPVHMWGIPQPVLEFIKKIQADDKQYYFAAGVNAGQVSRTLVQLQEVMRKKGMPLSGGLDIVMPSNYIPWGGPGPVARQQKQYAAAAEKIIQTAPKIKARQPFALERGPLWQRIVFTWIYHLSFRHVTQMDKDFWVDDQCTQCGLCEKVCPAQNIQMVNGKPVWQHRCEQCLACIQWCPQTAIQKGKKTPVYERYHHPAIKLTEIIAGISSQRYSGKGIDPQ